MTESHDDETQEKPGWPAVAGQGEDICPECEGSGRRDGGACPECGGSGRVTVDIAGA